MVSDTQRNKFRRRALIVRCCVAGAISALVYAFHPWFHSSLEKFFGMDVRLMDTLGTLGVLLFFVLFQKFLSYLYYKDSHFGMHAAIVEPARICPSNHLCERVVLPELKEIPPHVGMLTAQVNKVVEITESAVTRVTEQLIGVDETITALNQFVMAANSTSSQNASKSFARFAENQQLVERLEQFIHQWLDESEVDAERSRNAMERTSALVSLIELVREIAGQTSLLALNAAIEAARAGESGARVRGGRRRSQKTRRSDRRSRAKNFGWHLFGLQNHRRALSG